MGKEFQTLSLTRQKVLSMTDRNRTPDELLIELNSLREQLREQKVLHAAADLLPQILLILDSSAKIVASNNAWETFLTDIVKTEVENGGLGQDYFNIFRSVVTEAKSIEVARNGFKSVVEGKIPAFDLEYRCRCYDARWFLMRIVSISLDGNPGVIITHNDITQLIRTTVLAGKLLESHSNLPDQFEFDTESEELRLLGAYTHLASTSVTAKYFGQVSINKSYPTLFKRLVDDFDLFASKAVEKQIYKIESDKTSSKTDITMLSEKMGALNAGPRDVIEVYLAALKNKSMKASPSEMAAYADEAKLLVLELMGHLVSFYRNYSIGVRAYANTDLLRTIEKKPKG